MNNLIFFLVGFVLAIIFLGPFATIWALNTLFGLHIAYTFATWLAMVWLSILTCFRLSLKSGK